MPEFTLANLELINRAILSGVTTIHYENKTVTYRSLDELIRIRDLIRVELGYASRGGRVLASFSKGLT